MASDDMHVMTRLTNDNETARRDFEMGEPRSKTGHCLALSRRQVVVAILIIVGVVVLVGLLCYFLPYRQCDRDDGREGGKSSEIHSTTMDTKAASTAPSTPEPWNGRLPRNVIPEVYDLHIQPYINDDDVEGTHKRRFTFDGRVTIRLRCDIATNRITLHLNNITIYTISVTPMNGDEELYEAWSLEDPYTFLHIDLNRELTMGSYYNLTISYLGDIRRGLIGFYRSSYFDSNGNKVWLATTQMEPADARYALPCFDEPDLKAIFNVEIKHRSHMVALSNGREIVTIDHDDGWSSTKFEPTPVMSTYLLAFVVGIFEYRETNTSNGIRLRVWCRPEEIENTEYSLRAGSAIMTFFEEYFNISYQLPKVDMIAIPDFSAGAMENWGLITYQEYALLYDPLVNSLNEKLVVVSHISHELAHQWFGNLVTMRWWDDLWLNEGFGTYFESVGADFFEPELKMGESFVSTDMQGVLHADSTTASHPIRVPVESPAEIGSIFDGISYNKGAAVLRMLNNILGEDVFRRGIQIYLKSFTFSNADSDDLWNAFTLADKGHGNIEVKAIMDTWTLQMGYPVVTLNRVDRTTVNANQQRYLTSPDEGSDGQYQNLGYLWFIYLTHTNNGTRNFTHPSWEWIKNERSYTFMLEDGIDENDWYIANINMYGFYRVHYDDENWRRLTTQLLTNHMNIPVLNRAQLIEDAFSLAQTGNLSLEIALECTRYLSNEMEHIPLTVALKYFIYFRDMLNTTPGYGSLEKYLRGLTTPLYNRFGWNSSENATVNEKSVRSVVIPINCKVRNPVCIAEALRLYRAYMAMYNSSDPNNPDNNPINHDLSNTVYCIAVREGGQAEWDFAWNQYTSNSPSIRKWIDALSCSLRPWQIERLLEYPLADPDMYRRIPYQLVHVSKNPIGRSLAWDFFRHNYDFLFEIFGGSYQMWSYTIRSVTQYFNTEVQLHELTSFGEGRDFGTGALAYENAIDNTINNIAVVENTADLVTAWFEANAPEE